MSKDKYLSIFLPQMEAIVFIILQIFFATRTVLKIGEYLTIIHRSAGKYPLLSGLKIIFERWPVVLTGQTNFSSVMSRF